VRRPMSTATSRARQGCRWAHRHWPRLVKGLPGGQKTHLSKAAVRLGRQGVVELTNTNADEAKGVVKPLLGQQLWKWTLAAGVLTIVLGGIVLAWPGPTLLVASTLFGVYLLLTGFVGLFIAFPLPRSAGMRFLLFISGILSVVLAILSFRHFGDAYAILLLSLWIGIGFIFQGVSVIVAEIGESELPGRGWSVVLGVISVIAGLVVLVWPFDSIVVLVLVAGVWLVVLGVVQIIQSFQIRKDARTVREAIDSVSKRFTAR